MSQEYQLKMLIKLCCIHKWTRLITITQNISVIKHNYVAQEYQLIHTSTHTHDRIQSLAAPALCLVLTYMNISNLTVAKAGLLWEYCTDLLLHKEFTKSCLTYISGFKQPSYLG